MRRSQANDTCVHCARFTIADYPELAAVGQGWCTSWEQAKPWDGQIGVLFVEAGNRAARQRFVARLRAPKPEPEPEVTA